MHVLEGKYVSEEDRNMPALQIVRDRLRQEGLQEGYKNMALNLLKKGVDLKVILDATGLSEKELEDLKNP